MDNKRINVIKNYKDERNNEISCIGTNQTENNVDILFAGSNNKLIVGDSTISKCLIEFRGNNSTVCILDACRLSFRILLGSNSIINIGNRVTTTSMMYCTAYEGSNISIGDDCMFAGGVTLRADDAHPIFDVITKKRINISKSIYIGEHVWIGDGG